MDFTFDRPLTSSLSSCHCRCCKLPVVPRTFLGPLIISTFCHLMRFVCLPIFDIATRPLLVQFLARLCLLVINVVGWVRFAYAVDTYKGKKGRNVGAFLLLITASQFHIPFYASRMLPNTFALAILLQAYISWLNDEIQRAASWIVFATAVFRCDVLLLLASVGLCWLIMQQLTVVHALRIGAVSGIVSLMLTAPLDSLLWQRPLWPEGEVFYYNTILGKSSDWGTSPWHWYATSALPKSMLLTLLLVPLSVLRIPEYLDAWERKIRQSSPTSSVKVDWIDREWLPFLMPVAGFIALYSNLGHKEMRFIFPALPILNLAAASTVTRLVRLAFPLKDKDPTMVGRLAFFCGVMCLFSTFVGNLAFVTVSTSNYPGGDALLLLSNHIQNKVESLKESNLQIHVHIDVATSMSGVSLFGQRAAEAEVPGVTWTFNKGGYEMEHSNVEDFGKFTHILSESSESFSDFVLIGTVLGSPRLDIKGFRIATRPSIYILEKDGVWKGQRRS